MADIVVDIFTDENDGAGVGLGTSLREAIIAANSNGDVQNTIVLSGGTYSLTLTGGSEDASATGDLDIFDDGSGKTLTITGAGADSTIIDAGELDRVFHVLTGATLITSDVTVTNGVTPDTDPFSSSADSLGGGFLVEGTLNATNLVIDDNQASNGGGIFVNVDSNTGIAGVVNINDSTVSNNTATFDGGGISSLFGGQLTADNLTVIANTAARNAGGIGVAFQGSATISNSTIINNQTLGTVDTSPLPVGVGAGVHINDGTGTITNTFIAGNTAAGSGGGITIGGGDPTGQGGDAPVTVTVTDTVITGNTADSDADGVGDGGGIAVLNGTANVGNTALLDGSIVGNYDTPNSAGPGDVSDNVSGAFNSTGNNILTGTAGSTGFSSDSGDLFGVGPGVTLTLLNSFAFESGDGIAFDPVSGNLFGLQSIVTDPATFTNDADVIQITTDGTVVDGGGFAFSDTFDASGIDVLPDGTLLISSFAESSIRQYNPDGTLVDGGINFTPSTPLVSTVFNPLTGTIYGTDLFTGNIIQYDQSGNLLNQLDLTTIFPDGVSAQGLAINPFTGNLFVADDSGIPSATNGNSSIYEISRSGEILSVIDLVDLTGDTTFGDPEGLSFDANGDNLYVVFDDDDPNNVGDTIGVFQVNSNPQPLPPVDDLPGVFNFSQEDYSLVVELVSTSGATVQEVGVFFLDSNGTIGGVAPGDAGFTAAALGRTQVIQSVIPNLPTGFNQSGLQRVFNNFAAGTQIGFLRVNDGTINEAINGQATDIALSTDDDVTITTTEINNGFILDFDSELSLQVTSRQTSVVDVAVGNNLQNSGNIAAIDLSSVANASNFTAVVNREAFFDNDLLFYAGDDASGNVGGIAPNTDGSYLGAVLDNLIPGLDPFEVGNGETATFSGSLPAGAVVIPFIIVNGTLADLQDGDTTNDPSVFFPFLGANSDGAEHVRILGDNTFGFEDLVNGDDDFQDITVSVQLG